MHPHFFSWIRLCNNLSTLQYEIGYYLNLGHSREGNSAHVYYVHDDESCPMGFGIYNTHLSEDEIDRPRFLMVQKVGNLVGIAKVMLFLNHHYLPLKAIVLF